MWRRARTPPCWEMVMKKMLRRTTKAGFLYGEIYPGEILVPNKLFAILDIYLKITKNVVRNNCFQIVTPGNFLNFFCKLRFRTTFLQLFFLDQLIEPQVAKSLLRQVSRSPFSRTSLLLAGSCYNMYVGPTLLVHGISRVTIVSSKESQNLWVSERVSYFVSLLWRDSSPGMSRIEPRWLHMAAGCPVHHQLRCCHSWNSPCLRFLFHPDALLTVPWGTQSRWR